MLEVMRTENIFWRKCGW